MRANLNGNNGNISLNEAWSREETTEEKKIEEIWKLLGKDRQRRKKITKQIQ